MKSSAFGGAAVTQMSVGRYRTCAIPGGAACCWGGNCVGQLGDGTTNYSPVPIAVNGGALSGQVLQMVQAGGDVTFALF